MNIQGWLESWCDTEARFVHKKGPLGRRFGVVLTIHTEDGPVSRMGYGLTYRQALLDAQAKFREVAHDG